MEKVEENKTEEETVFIENIKLENFATDEEFEKVSVIYRNLNLKEKALLVELMSKDLFAYFDDPESSGHFISQVYPDQERINLVLSH